jgi:hypothetical protein
MRLDHTVLSKCDLRAAIYRALEERARTDVISFVRRHMRLSAPIRNRLIQAMP